MTDKEKLMKLLDEFGINYTSNNDREISCEAGDTKVRGYTGSSATFNFDNTGTFRDMEIWE